MSYILDALKKMEHEKAKKDCTPGMVNISGELFREHKPQVVSSGLWKIVSVAVVAAVFTCGMTWMLLYEKKEKVDKKAQDMNAVLLTSKTVLLPPNTNNLPAAGPSVAPAVPETSPLPTHSVAPAPLASGAASVAARPVEPRLNVVPPSDLRISGIAWQEERKARRAVVNGLLLQEGSLVSGARITEIMHDRVRFSMSNGYFELSMPASGLPGPK